MKVAKLTSVAMSFALVLVLASMGHANSEEFTLSAEIPAATGASFGVSKVIDGIFSEHPSNNLDFGTLDFFDFGGGNQAFLAAHYFAIDIGGEGGVGIPVITLSYVDTGAPVGAVANLGERATLGYALMTDDGTTETGLGVMSLDTVASGLTILPIELAGGFLRLNVSTASGNEDVSVGVVPFNPGDAPGSYTGTLTVTGTPE